MPAKLLPLFRRHEVPPKQSAKCFGNWIGFKLAEGFASAQASRFSPDYGSLLLEVPREVNLAGFCRASV